MFDSYCKTLTAIKAAHFASMNTHTCIIASVGVSRTYVYKQLLPYLLADSSAVE